MIQLRTDGYRAPPAALLVKGAVKVLADARGVSLPAASARGEVVTILR